MSREEPYFRKCCLCIPLKLCLRTWAWIKLIADICIAVVLFLLILFVLVSFYKWLTFQEFALLYACAIGVVLLVCDAAFMIVLLVGLRKKNLRTLRMSYIYNVCMVGLSSLFVLGEICFGIRYMNVLGWENFGISLTCGIINICLNVCIIFTLKSEMIKLRNKQQFEFVKMPSSNEDTSPAELKEPFATDDENINV